MKGYMCILMRAKPPSLLRSIPGAAFLGGTVNDAVLATVTGGLRSFLGDVRGDRRPHDLRALTPVTMRSDREQTSLGNRVSAWLVDMPVGEGSPRRRLTRLSSQTGQLRDTDSARGLEILSALGSGTLTLAMRITLLSYAGRLCWGFNADRDLVPDLAKLRQCVSASFDELLALARQRKSASIAN
jgi:hypothetical protein